MTVRPAKTQISLGLRPVWSESLLCTQWVAKDLRFLHADSEEWSDWADAQNDFSLRWTQSHFVGFVMRRLNYLINLKGISLFAPCHDSAKTEEKASDPTKNRRALKSPRSNNMRTVDRHRAPFIVWHDIRLKCRTDDRFKVITVLLRQLLSFMF